MQTAPSTAVSAPSSSSSPSLSASTSSSVSAVGLGQAQHSPGRVLFTPQGSSMILSQESLQMFLQQDQRQQTENDSAPSVGIPASVIVSSSAADLAPSGHDGLVSEAQVGLCPSPGPTHMAAVVKQVPSTGHPQPLRIQSMSPSQPLATHTAPPPLADSPQPSPSPLTLGQHVQSPHHQQQSRPPSQPQAQAQTPSRSCTPSSLPPLFIVHNQLPGSPQPAPPPQQQQQQQHPPPPPTHIQLQLQPQPRPPSQPAPFQPDMPPTSCSPKPPQAPPAQFQFAAPPLSAVVKTQAALPGLTAEQQHHLQLVAAQLQTLSTIAQPSPQQKQLLDKLHQVQQNILLQAKQSIQTPLPFSSQEVPVAPAGSSPAGAGTPVQLPPLLQQTSVLVKTPATAANDLQVFSGSQGLCGASGNQVVTPASLTQSVQTATLKMPFCMEPSKEARMLEQLRRQQGSVLYPDQSAPFRSYEDTLHRLLPYHLYQGTPSSPHDYRRVDDEFESVSSQLLKRTQAMIDKYRHLLFEESKQRLGPSAEMVMIDRMFIQEEKMALGQDRILAKERPEEYVANSRMLETAAAVASLPPLPAGLSSGSAGCSATEPPPLPKGSTPKPAPPAAHAPAPSTTPAPAPPPSHFPSTKLVIKQGGGGASVSWSSSCSPAPGVKPAESPRQSSSFSRAPPPSSSYSSSRLADDDDALPQRTSKPPIKTYEARRRIGLKLKIKQEAGFSKVVHNTALDPVHTQPQHNTQPQPQPQPSVKASPAPPSITTVIRTPPPTCSAASLSTSSVETTQSTLPHRSSLPPSAARPPSSSSSHSWSSSTSSSTSSMAQMNGTLEHHDVSGVKRNPASTATPPQTTCRLPLRKTYRENISPRVRPGVPGGGGDSLPYPRPVSSPPKPQTPSSPSASDRTVIASVKLENRSSREASHPRAEPALEGGRLGNSVDAPAHVFTHGIKTPQRRSEREEREEEEEERGEAKLADSGADAGKYKRVSSKNRQRDGGTFRMDQHAPGPPSPPESSFTRDSSLPAKRCKSDSPDMDMDNASFSSGSPPDESLTDHLQSAIDSILNLQQGPTARSQGSKGGSSRSHHHHHHHHHSHSQRPGGSGASAHRPSVPPSSSGSSSASLAPGRGHNGSLVPQTQSR